MGPGGSLRGLEESNSGNGEAIKQRALHLHREEAESSTPERMEFWDIQNTKTRPGQRGGLVIYVGNGNNETSQETDAGVINESSTRFSK